jgi:hypothetical protein
MKASTSAGQDAGLRAGAFGLDLDGPEMAGGDEAVDVPARAVELLGDGGDRHQLGHAATSSSTRKSEVLIPSASAIRSSSLRLKGCRPLSSR